MLNRVFTPSSSKVPVVPLHMHRDGGIKLCAGFGFGFASVNRSDHHAHSFHGVEASSVVRPEDAVLELVAIHATRVPDSVEIGLAACIVPPATFMEVSTVSCRKVRQEKISKAGCSFDWNVASLHNNRGNQRWLG